MKKILFAPVAVAAIMLSSCSNEEIPVTVQEEGNVIFTATLPGTINSRAYADGQTAKNLNYAVYSGSPETGLTHIAGLDGTGTFTDLKSQVTLHLATGKTYTVVFWAASSDAPYEFGAGANTATIKVKQEGNANDETRDAFYATETFTINGAINKTVTLTRPFAQINIGTNDLEDFIETEGEISTSGIKVKGYSTLDLISGEASNEILYDLEPTTIPEGETFPVIGYEYLTMNYILVGEGSDETGSKSVVDIEWISDNTDAPSVSFTQIPVQRNYRTNIYGSLLTNPAIYDVIIKPDFETPDYNHDAMEDLLYAAANGGTIVLQEDVEIPGELTFTKNAVVDLGGNEIKTEGGTYGDAIVVKSGANVTFKNGTIKEAQNAKDESAVIYVSSATPASVTLEEMTLEGSHPVYVNSAAAATTVTINSGNYTCSGTNGEVVYVQKGGKVVINGGTFSNPTATEYSGFLLNIKDDFRKTLNDPREAIEVFGGIFYNFDPANNAAEGAGTNFVAEGYKSVETIVGGDKIYTVVPNDTEVVKITSQDDFADALSADNAIFYIDDATLTLPSKSLEGKNFTFIGDGENTLIKDLNHESATGSNLTFENLTLQVAKGGSATSLGFKGAETISLKNVVVKGEFHTFTATTAVFEGCTFNFDSVNDAARQGLWCETYGTTVIKDCIFQVIPPTGKETKAILIYSDDNTNMGDVEVTNCQFLTGNESEKAAVEIHSEKFTSAGTLTITGCTFDEKTYKGGLWREICNVSKEGIPEGTPTQFYKVIVNGEVKQEKAQ